MERRQRDPGVRASMVAIAASLSSRDALVLLSARDRCRQVGQALARAFVQAGPRCHDLARGWICYEDCDGYWVQSLAAGCGRMEVLIGLIWVRGDPALRCCSLGSAAIGRMGNFISTCWYVLVDGCRRGCALGCSALHRLARIA
ncbi:MAG: hypothetical protein ACJAQ3_002391 [Planctomycetota bacterium]|jgi:hypothetical protein